MRFYMLLAVALLLNSVMSTGDVSIHEKDATRRKKRNDVSPDNPCPSDVPYYCLSLKADTCCKTECDSGNRCNSPTYEIWR
nr:conotoxin precursor Cerm01 [Conus judaeus]UMA83556.1 conotoxin precursor Cerm01 [Conus judaeus]UMA83895.1 conotoxin precursor Cerm01 [Conus judaeus]DAZ86551.1 TPA_inf: conotoxin precursor Cerm01 [Conus judaeus]DAZ86901.1 TPA_inf: conotoxin precursor Cerm01 [Conus judaeus]